MRNLLVLHTSVHRTLAEAVQMMIETPSERVVCDEESYNTFAEVTGEAGRNVKYNKVLNPKH